MRTPPLAYLRDGHRKAGARAFAGRGDRRRILHFTTPVPSATRGSPFSPDLHSSCTPIRHPVTLSERKSDVCCHRDSMGDATTLAVARAIRAERAAARLTQEALARRIGWSRQRIVDIEAGSSQVPVGWLPELCAALGCDLAAILSRVSEEDRRALGL